MSLDDGVVVADDDDDDDAFTTAKVTGPSPRLENFPENIGLDPN